MEKSSKKTLDKNVFSSILFWDFVASTLIKVFTTLIALVVCMKKIFIMLVTSCLVYCLPYAVGHAAQSAQSAQHQVTLQDTIRFALSYSPNIKAAQEARQQSVHNVRMAEAGYYPTIGIWAGVGIEQTDSATTRASDWERDVVGTGNAGLTVSQTLWQGGLTSASVRMREEEVQYRSWLLMDSTNSLVYSAISAHSDLLRRKELVRLSESNVRENKNILRILRTRYNQGLSSDGDVKLVQGRVGRAEATLSANKQGLQSAMATYTRVTGQPAPQSLAPVPMPLRVINDIDEARNMSVNKNLRIQSDLAAIRNAMADVDVARSNFSPVLSLDAGPSYVDQGYRGDQHQFTWSAMLNMQWEIYSGGADEANVKAKAARVRELRRALNQTMDQVNEELIITFVTTKSSEEQTKFYGQAAIAARGAKTNYDAQFRVGQKDLLSVLDAEGEYYFSATEQEIRKTDALLGYYRLLALTGELLDEMNVNGAELQIDTTTIVPANEHQPWNFGSSFDTQEALSGTTLTMP